MKVTESIRYTVSWIPGRKRRHHGRSVEMAFNALIVRVSLAEAKPNTAQQRAAIASTIIAPKLFT